MAKKPKTGGRRKGTPNRFTGKIRNAIESAFDKLQRDPVARLVTWAKKNPSDFYKLAARLIPSEHSVSGRMTLEELVLGSLKK